MQYFQLLIMLSLITAFSGRLLTQDNLDVETIIEKAQEKIRGTESSRSVSKMSIIRPTWSREITIKSWSKGDDYSLMLITAPARDKGTTFLKRDKEIWTWQPAIDRAIKLPPSMMMQSWMGSDFTNDDLVRESSMIDDYDHQLLDKEKVNGWECYKIEMIPKPEAAVVWSKIITWIDMKEYMQLKSEFYDEDGYLVSTMIGSEVKEMGGKVLPAHIEMIPTEEEGHKTAIDQLEIQFDEKIEQSFFSIQNMQRVQ